MTAMTGMLPDEVDALVERLGFPRYRSDQLLRALYKQFASSIADMTLLPGPLREALAAERYSVSPAVPVREVRSDDGDTTKALVRLAEGTLIETVLMQYSSPPGRHPRSTVCVSTQAGCAMGCIFCATGQMGFERNLSAAEIVVQVTHFASLLAGRGQHVTNVVFMGMGEPLANYTETVRALRILTDARAFGLAQRSITVSTVGVIRGIDRLAAEGLQIGLAISLHAPNDALRRRLVPTAGPTSVGDLMSAARRYFRKTGRRVSFEYALIAGVNDTEDLAAQLGDLLTGTGAHVNLIPVNPTAGKFTRPARAAVVAFERRLRAAGVNCTVRVEKGSEISAACGQLRTTEAAAPNAPRARLATNRVP